MTPEEPAPVPPGDPIRILVVEDEDDMCWAFRMLLEADGELATVVQTAAAAIETMSAGEYRLAFVDAKLPDMAGLDLVGRLKALAPEAHCFIVSGYFYGDDEPVRAALTAGVICGFIGKPFVLEQIRTACRHARGPGGRGCQAGVKSPGGE